MKVSQDRLWAGTEESLQASLTLEADIAAKMLAGMFPEDDEDDDHPYLYERQGSVGVVNIKGPLSNRTTPWDAYFGRTTYSAIRDALVFAANDVEVSQIMLDIDSGGGAVAGVDDTARLITMVNTKVKPVTAFTDGAMASAAYWLGSSAEQVFSTNTSLVGSIGVISTHMEYSKELKDAGVGVTVLRAGKFKALANPYEPLSKEGEAQIQAMLDATYNIFVGHVADMRGRTFTEVDSTMAQGREFMGQAAVGVGLVDALMSFDEVVTKLSAESIDASKNSMDNRGKQFQGTIMKKALTEQEIAALAAGGTAGAAEAEQETAETETEQEAEVVEEVQAESKPEVPAADAAVVNLLQTQLSAKDKDLLEANVKLAEQSRQLAEVQATFDGLLTIARTAVSHLSVALGGSAEAGNTLGAAQALAEHARLAEQFKRKFKSGGVAAVDAAQNKTTTPVSPRQQARVNGARFNKQGA